MLYMLLDIIMIFIFKKGKTLCLFEPQMGKITKKPI